MGQWRWVVSLLLLLCHVVVIAFCWLVVVGVVGWLLPLLLVGRSCVVVVVVLHGGVGFGSCCWLVVWGW